MRFADIPGHAEIKTRLREMADTGRIPHALLLEGAEGTAKFALARAFAQYVHCTDRTPDGDSCGHCPDCLQHQSFNHIDTIYSFPVFKKKGGKTTLSSDYAEEFRSFITADPYMDFAGWIESLGSPAGQPAMFVEEAAALVERLSRAARQARYKIVLVWLPERMRLETANKLLKLIEEPFSDTLFIMTADAPRNILPTIYSRTQRIAVPPYSEAEIRRILADNDSDAEDSAIDAAATLAEGSVTAGRRLLAADSSRVRYLALFKQLMRLSWQRDIMGLRAWSAEISGLGREGSAAFYTYCSRLLRENFMLNIAPADPGLVSLTADELAFSRNFNPFVNERNILGLMEMLDQAVAHTTLNGNGKIIAFDTALQSILLLKR